MARSEEWSRFRLKMPGGSTWSHVLKRHTKLRIVDVEGGANVSALFFHVEVPAERYNMPGHAGRPNTRRSSRAGASSCRIWGGRSARSWPTPAAGTTRSAGIRMLRSSNPLRASRYGEARNEMHRNARDNFLVELGKWGLGAE